MIRHETRPRAGRAGRNRRVRVGRSAHYRNALTAATIAAKKTSAEA